MYLRILKRDLKRKKTMNVILLIFIILAATFIASSVNNMLSISNAMDYYLEKAEMPDYWFSTADKKAVDEFKRFAKEENYEYRCMELVQVVPTDIRIGGKDFDYTNTCVLSSLKNSTKVFDKENSELTKVNDGEIYVSAQMYYSDKYGFREGEKIEIASNGRTKVFTLKGYMKDAAFGPSTSGMTRMLISESDYEYFVSVPQRIWYSVNVYTDDVGYMNKYNKLGLNTTLSVDRAGIESMYTMDMITAAVTLIVSICLILISMVILRFTIQFTLSQEFREIGVMKAIGIDNRKIRGLYIVKYLAISLIGSTIGLVCSVPFGKLLIRDAQHNIIIPDGENFFINVICAFSVGAVTVLFCYFCARKIKGFTPVDAIRNGENGKRYSRKGIVHLNRIGIAPVPFMAVNDILSGIKRFITMIVIFLLGILLIIIPLNTINTLQSDNLLTWFNMAKCDHIISQELLFGATDNKEEMEKEMSEVKQKLQKKDIQAEVFREAVFRMCISHKDKRMSSLAFQGVGDVTCEQYEYIRGTAPERKGEVAISHIVADRIGADIGDDVEINVGDKIKRYTVTAINQSMNQMGEGIRFYQEEELDYSHIAGNFGMQLRYMDSPGKSELSRRKELLKEFSSKGKVCETGEYINLMIGEGISNQIESIKWMILLVILCINILVTVLMVKSFITKEKGEIAMLKVLGFRNSALVAWQTLRIGIVLFLSIVVGTLLSTPLSKATVEPVFQSMGAQSIKFEIRPLEVYVIYPLIVLIVTVLAGMIAALQVRKIPASETSNIE